jgi:hypothetical protein
MKRRTLLKSALALALPMANRTGHAMTIPIEAEAQEEKTDVLFSGLSGLDYPLGGLSAGELLCVTGPPCSGKTLLLLDLAARICGRYGKNVVFWSAHQPSVYLARKMAIKGATRVAFAEETDFVVEWDEGVGDSAGVVVAYSRSVKAERAHSLVELLTAEHPRGCAALVMDGWCTTPERRENIEFVDGIAAFPAERWPHTLLSVKDIHQAKLFAETNQLPVVMGVKTASLVDDEALANSFHLSAQLQVAADRLVSLYRPELYVETSQAIAADKNVVCLSGKSPRWWDTRCSRLLFDPRRLGFSTVV